MTDMQDPRQQANRQEDDIRRKPSFLATAKAVFWSFFGVRKKSDYERDAAQLNPVHVVIAGILGALIFIATLIIIVRLVVAQ